MKIKIFLEELTVEEAQILADQLMKQFEMEGCGYVPERALALNSLKVNCKREVLEEENIC